jgi:hypothetical protein
MTTTARRFLVVAEKAAGPPFGGSAKPFGTKPQGGADAMPVVPDEEIVEDEELVEEEVATHEWAGDLINESVDTPTDPAAAFRTFAGTEGETAWLDRADDGTLTGWVQDADGSIYRYSDADAWAIDVDEAGMIAGGAEPMEDEEVLDEEAMDVEDGTAAGGEDLGQDDFLMEGKQVVLRAVVPPHH